jgi:hypothetical protein
MKPITIILLVILIAACKSKAFVKHDLEFEKIADNCTTIKEGINMNSNLNGERFQFESCLDADFKKEQLSSIRQGDTVILKFERKNPTQAKYNITIDLDAYPRYNYLIIDGIGIGINEYNK